MRVAIVHNAIAEGETDPSTLDVLDQVAWVAEGLRAAGHEPVTLPFERDVAGTARRVLDCAPDALFNLVESVDGHASLHPCAAALWELMGLPHTGSPSGALERCTDKHSAKSLLRASGLPTPEWAACRGAEDPSWKAVPAPWFLKPNNEDASLGIDDEAAVVRDETLMARRIGALAARFPGQAVLVERYIHGREFNVALLAGSDGPTVMPPAEMLFKDYPAGRDRVLGFRAKWVEDSYEYAHTGRTFDLPASDGPLIEQLGVLARRCWGVFGLRGYARVDFRVDEAGRPWIIEINPNPCLAPEAGFAAAVARAGLSPAEVVGRILEDCVWIPREPKAN